MRPFLDLYLKRLDRRERWHRADFLIHGLEAENSEELAVDAKVPWQKRHGHRPGRWAPPH